MRGIDGSNYLQDALLEFGPEESISDSDYIEYECFIVLIGQPNCITPGIEIPLVEQGG